MDPFGAIADPTRRKIVGLLAGGEKDAGTIASHFTISKPAISRHLSVLREGGIVESRRDAQRRVYSIRHEGLMEIGNWLSRYQEHWRDRLDALESALKEEK